MYHHLGHTSIYRPLSHPFRSLILCTGLEFTLQTPKKKTQKPTHTQTTIKTYTDTHQHTDSQLHTHKHSPTHTQTLTHKQTHTHTHTHTDLLKFMVVW